MTDTAGFAEVGSTSVRSSRPERVADVLRDIARGALAGMVAGVLVGGLGGRLAMTIAARLNPGATGALTENGNVVGVFTLSGTIELVIFGGLFGGAIGAVLWVVVAPWLPANLRVRVPSAGLLAACLASSLVVEATNTDFRILDPDPLLIALFLGLVALIGAATAWLDRVFDRRLPGAGFGPVGIRITAYGVLALLGAPALILAVSAYFSPGFSQAEEPFLVGLGLLACGAATLTWWATRVVSGSTHPAPALVTAGRVSLLAAALLGAAHIWETASRIIAAG